MNLDDQQRWRNDVLEFALRAFAAHAPLRDALIFKGARIMNLRLGDTPSRQSFDLDSNLDIHCETSHPQKEDRRAFLDRESELALKRRIAQQDPARFRFRSVRTELSPPRDTHPFDWTGFKVKIGLLDDERPTVKDPPSVEIDIAAHETLGEGVVSDLTLRNGLVIRAYTLERIAGEKMRAFLSSLHAYMVKIGRRPAAVRVKDLYDLARIRRQYEVANNAFWKTAGREFQLACESRFVDCAGIATFAEDIDRTRHNFNADSTLPKDITFDEAWDTVREAVSLFTDLRIIPFAFEIPDRLPQEHQNRA